MTESDAPVDFFDTSALIKHYHDESGSAAVDAVFDDPDAVRIITDIALLEFHSAFARRVRMREITPQDYHHAKAELEGDIREGRLRVEVLGEQDKADAARLLEQYGLTRELRTLDALHLAVMRRLGPQQLRAVYCADRSLGAILATEGFTVIDPESSPVDNPDASS